MKVVTNNGKHLFRRKILLNDLENFIFDNVPKLLAEIKGKTFKPREPNGFN